MTHSPTRYDVTLGMGGARCVESFDGKYVLYEDYDRLEAENKKLREMVEKFLPKKRE